VAEELGALAERLHFVTHVAEMNSVKAVRLLYVIPLLLVYLAYNPAQELLMSFTFTIFVVSTTGQGEIPANARSFWRSLLLKKLPPTFLSGVNYVSFGLGDSSYPK
jgi:sulfite reductase alpha subunit-like flavoprotein